MKKLNQSKKPISECNLTPEEIFLEEASIIYSPAEVGQLAIIRENEGRRNAEIARLRMAFPDYADSANQHISWQVLGGKKEAEAREAWESYFSQICKGPFTLIDSRRRLCTFNLLINLFDAAVDFFGEEEHFEIELGGEENEGCAKTFQKSCGIDGHGFILYSESAFEIFEYSEELPSENNFFKRNRLESLFPKSAAAEEARLIAEGKLQFERDQYKQMNSFSLAAANEEKLLKADFAEAFEPDFEIDLNAEMLFTFEIYFSKEEAEKEIALRGEPESQEIQEITFRGTAHEAADFLPANGLKYYDDLSLAKNENIWAVTYDSSFEIEELNMVHIFANCLGEIKGNKSWVNEFCIEEWAEGEEMQLQEETSYLHCKKWLSEKSLILKEEKKEIRKLAIGEYFTPDSQIDFLFENHFYCIEEKRFCEIQIFEEGSAEACQVEWKFLSERELENFLNSRKLKAFGEINFGDLKGKNKSELIALFGRSGFISLNEGKEVLAKLAELNGEEGRSNFKRVKCELNYSEAFFAEAKEIRGKLDLLNEAVDFLSDHWDGCEEEIEASDLKQLKEISKQLDRAMKSDELLILLSEIQAMEE